MAAVRLGLAGHVLRVPIATVSDMRDVLQPWYVVTTYTATSSTQPSAFLGSRLSVMRREPMDSMPYWSRTTVEARRLLRDRPRGGQRMPT
ncbi:hypothetical protein SHIRM173S_08282 [Streptomyces hirsutus]